MYLNDLDPKAARAQLYADRADGSGPVRQEMKRVCQLAGVPASCVYRAAVHATRPATDYTARVIPHRPGAKVPLESARILWQR